LATVPEYRVEKRMPPDAARVGQPDRVATIALSSLIVPP